MESIFKYKPDIIPPFQSGKKDETIANLNYFRGKEFIIIKFEVNEITLVNKYPFKIIKQVIITTKDSYEIDGIKYNKFYSFAELVVKFFDGNEDLEEALGEGVKFEPVTYKELIRSYKNRPMSGIAPVE